MKLVVDGFGKSVAKRDNQIVIKENGRCISNIINWKRFNNF